MDKQYFVYGETEIAYLQRKDKKLGAAIDRIGPIRREVNGVLFAALVESIVSQQISAKAAETIISRLASISDLTPASLYAMNIADIQQCGMSTRKAVYIHCAAEAAMAKQVDFDMLPNLSDENIILVLTTLPGVGVWTAEMMLIFSLQRPDVVSYGDLAIRRGMMNLYGCKELPKQQFDRYRKRYSPYGSVASLYLWALSAE